MTPTVTGIIGLLALFILIFSRMPVGFVMALIGFTGFGYIVNYDAALNLIAKDIFDVFGSYNLTVIPLFILMGQISFHAGISSRLFEVAYKFIGHWPGGMAIATIGACAGFSAICGSTNATAATMAAVTLPEMRRYRYKDTLAAGVVGAALATSNKAVAIVGDGASFADIQRRTGFEDKKLRNIIFRLRR